MQKGEEAKLKVTAEALKKINTGEFQFHKKTAEEVIQQLKTNQKTGLSKAEAEKRLQEYGPNELDKEEEESLWEKIKEQFEDILVRILLLSAIISFIFAVTGDGEEGLTAYVEPFVILLILILNAIVSIWQDSNADKALEALKEMQAISCLLLRDGEWRETDSKLLVPGDIVRVKIGDRIPADLRLIQMNSVSLKIEEAPLTGESVSVEKIIKPMEGEAPMLQDQRNMLFSSTVVTYGNAEGVVVFTGMKTAIGRVQEDVKDAGEKEEATPLKKKLDAFGEQLSYMIGIVCLLVWIMNYSKFFDEIHGTPIKGCIYYFKIAIALAVAAIPEGLPAVITTCLALGTRKMAKNNAIVRRLPSVQTLGCTTVICSDKTGTLTKNEMCAVKLAYIGSSIKEIKTMAIEEKSYSPIGLVHGLSVQNLKEGSPLREMAIVCALNSSAKIVKEGGKYIRQGEPTEAALIVGAEKIGKVAENSIFENDPTPFQTLLLQKSQKIGVLEFSSERKTMSTIVKGLDLNKQKSNQVLLKGAPERVIEKCATFKNEAGEVKAFDKAEKEQLLASVKQLAGEGLRCLAAAIIYDGGYLKDVTPANQAEKLSQFDKYDHYETGGCFLGIMCIKDPVRQEVKQSIKECNTAGIRVVMITGDSKDTAIAIAKELAIITEASDLNRDCFTGAEFAQMTQKERVQCLSGHGGKVFSRVEPRHKKELVKCLIDMDQVVAMTGDGVNDAPALKQAHIGVAMGITGTEVAKEASDMVLADDNFATIVKAVEEGRSIYSNMKAFIRYLISSNIGEVASIFITAMLGIPEGFNSVQLLWVNLVTDGPPATALSFNPPDKDIMKKPPRDENDSLISNWVLFRYTVVGLYVGFATVGIFVWWYVFAETGDGHTLVTFDQLSHWSECPSWTDFHVNDILGLNLAADPCLYFTKGKAKASTLSLSVLVTIEMLNALNALSEDNSLLVMPPWINPYLILAILASIGIHCVILYVPFFNQVFSITALTQYEWAAVFAFSAPVILVDEILKFFGRIANERDLQARLKKQKTQ